MWNNKGQSLMEVVVATAVGVLVVMALVFATIFSLRNANFAKNSAQATKLAQEGIEMVRLGRDRNRSIEASSMPSSDVKSWDGNGSSGSCDSIWCYQFTIMNGCDSPSSLGVDGKKCYFKINSGNGVLTFMTSSPTFPSSFAEEIKSFDQSNISFQRVVYLSDDANWQTQKTVTVVVRWTDFAGPHESKLSTILRKL